MHLLIFIQHIDWVPALSLGMGTEHEQDTWGFCSHVPAIPVGMTVVNTCRNHWASNQSISLCATKKWNRINGIEKRPLWAHIWAESNHAKEWKKRELQLQGLEADILGL